MRLDYQLSPETRVMGKVSAGQLFEPFLSTTNFQSHPAAAGTNAEYNDGVSSVSSRRC